MRSSISSGQWKQGRTVFPHSFRGEAVEYAWHPQFESRYAEKRPMLSSGLDIAGNLYGMEPLSGSNHLIDINNDWLSQN